MEGPVSIIFGQLEYSFSTGILDEITVFKLLVLRIVNWSYDYSLRIIILLVTWNLTQSAGAVEYTDCLTAMG